jgi:hypothetical protein
MKRPCHGIRSTWPKAPKLKPIPIKTNEPWQPAAQINPPVLPLFQEVQAYPGQGYGATTGPNLVGDDDNESIANVFCFGAFADKHSGIVLTGSLPFMSYKGSICFFILYHYESNSILAMPIMGLYDVTIFNAYKQQFELFPSNGFKPKLNVMDNQATKHIKTFLTEQDCKLQLMEPHNHCVNVAKHAIQTFKDAFIAMLATTNSDFPLQLWD